MCQLFALTSKHPVSPDFSLRGFFQRGGNTGDHIDGWGLALFRDDKIEIQKHLTAAYSCHNANVVLQNKPRATTVIAHIRKATEGKVTPQNTHPFARNLWGDTWIFAHNGTLKNFYPQVDSEFEVFGNTDSERAFCYLLSVLKQSHPEKPTSLETLVTTIHDTSNLIAEYGNFNFLLANDSILLAYCSTELYWTYREPPFEKIELLDCNTSIDISKINSSDDKMFVIATKPLTRGEAWFPMGKGELKVFSQGKTIYELPPNIKDSPNIETWNSAWKSGEIILS